MRQYRVVLRHKFDGNQLFLRIQARTPHEASKVAEGRLGQPYGVMACSPA